MADAVFELGSTARVAVGASVSMFFYDSATELLVSICVTADLKR